MNYSIAVPKWILSAVIGPLVVTVIANGANVYYGQKDLARTVSELGQTVAKLPRKADLQNEHDLTAYRLRQVEISASRNASTIEKNRLAIDHLPASPR